MCIRVGNESVDMQMQPPTTLDMFPKPQHSLPRFPTNVHALTCNWPHPTPPTSSGLYALH